MVFEEHLLIFDYNLNLLQDYLFEASKNISKVIEYQNNYYVLLNNELARESFVYQFDLNMVLLRKNQINAKSKYTEVKDILFYNNQIYITGYEYVNEMRMNTIDKYAGFLYVYDCLLSDANYYSIGKGLGINSTIIHNEQMISIGIFNPKSTVLSFFLTRSNNKGFISRLRLSNYKTKVLNYL